MDEDREPPDSEKKRNLNDLIEYIRRGSRCEIPRHAANKVKNYVDLFTKRKRARGRMNAEVGRRLSKPPPSKQTINGRQDNQPTDKMVRENMDNDEDEDRPRRRAMDGCGCTRKRRPRPCPCPCRRKRKKSCPRRRRRSCSKRRRKRSCKRKKRRC